MTRRWLGWVILGGTMILIFVVGSQLKSELSPLEDRSWFRLISTSPEGSSYEFMDNYMDKVAGLVADSVPERRITLTITAPSSPDQVL